MPLMFRNLASHHRLMTGLTACGLVVIGLWWHVQRCQRQVARLKHEAATLEAAFREFPARVARQVQLYRQIDSARQSRQRWIGQATVEQPAHVTVSHILTTARLAELTLTRAEPLPPQVLHTGHWHSLRFSVTGPFSGLRQFLQDLERFDQPLLFDQLALSHQASAFGEEPTLTAEISLRIFQAATKSSEIAGNTESVARTRADNYR